MVSTELEGPARQSCQPHVNQTRRIVALKAVALGVVALILISRSPSDANSLAGSAMTAAGQGLIMVAVIGRLWSTLYIGGRKNTCLVTTGPYSVTRNPLYGFSILGAAGVGLVFGSLVIAAILGGSIAVLLTATARAEAAVLGRLFGASYQAYAQRVPLLWPRLSVYRDADLPSCQPQALRRALGDGLLFLLAVPIAEMVNHARTSGLLPHLIALF